MDGEELRMSLDFAYDWDGAVAVRYPRGKVFAFAEAGGNYPKLEYGKAAVVMADGELCCDEDGKSVSGDVALFAVGNMVQTALEAARILKEEECSCTVVNMRFVKPFDEERIRELVPKHRIVVTMEDNEVTGGFGQQVEAMLVENGIFPEHFLNVSIKDRYVEHGTPEELYERYGMDAQSVAEKVRRMTGDGTCF